MYTTEAYGCKVTIKKLGNDYFDVTVSYKSYNGLGELVACPTWPYIGSGEEAYLFVLERIAYATGHTHPVIDLDLPMLQTGTQKVYN